MPQESGCRRAGHRVCRPWRRRQMTARELLRAAANDYNESCDDATCTDEGHMKWRFRAAALRVIADRIDAEYETANDPIMGTDHGRLTRIALLNRLDAPVTPGEPGATCGTCKGTMTRYVSIGAFGEVVVDQSCPDCTPSPPRSPEARHVGHKVTWGMNRGRCSACLHPFDEPPDYPPCESTAA